MSTTLCIDPHLDDQLQAVERDLASVSVAIAQAKLILSSGAVPDLKDLPPALVRIREAIARLPAGAGKKIEIRLMALLDDAATLETGLRQSLATLDNRRQARDTHQQAAAAYRSPHGR